VAGGAAEGIEQALTRERPRSCRQHSVARRNLRAPHELREVIDVGEPSSSGTSSGSFVILPIEVVSFGRKRLVTPISFR
jgi:hypothetical protein